MRCAVIQMFDNTSSTENFTNLYPHRALNQANTVYCLVIGTSTRYKTKYQYQIGNAIV